MTIDYFAELYVAGRFAEAGWNVYFPHRDQGFDFIVSKNDSKGYPVIRPVQVKGKYPTSAKGNKIAYGYVGKLTQLRDDMILAIPFFAFGSSDMPVCTAYLPRPLIKKHPRGYRCLPASFKQGVPAPRREYKKFFGKEGLLLLGTSGWVTSELGTP